LRWTAASWLALARTRELETTFPRLTIGLGIIVDKVRDLEMMGLSGEKDLVKEERDRVAEEEELRRLARIGTRADEFK
jgi:hypothetical protein